MCVFSVGRNLINKRPGEDKRRIPTCSSNLHRLALLLRRWPLPDDWNILPDDYSAASETGRLRLDSCLSRSDGGGLTEDVGCVGDDVCCQCGLSQLVERIIVQTTLPGAERTVNLPDDYSDEQIRGISLDRRLPKDFLIEDCLQHGPDSLWPLLQLLNNLRAADRARVAAECLLLPERGEDGGNSWELIWDKCAKGFSCWCMPDHNGERISAVDDLNLLLRHYRTSSVPVIDISSRTLSPQIPIGVPANQIDRQVVCGGGAALGMPTSPVSLRKLASPFLADSCDQQKQSPFHPRPVANFAGEEKGPCQRLVQKINSIKRKTFDNSRRNHPRRKKVEEARMKPLPQRKITEYRAANHSCPNLRMFLDKLVPENPGSCSALTSDSRRKYRNIRQSQSLRDLTASWDRATPSDVSDVTIRITGATVDELDSDHEIASRNGNYGTHPVQSINRQRSFSMSDFRCEDGSEAKEGPDSHVFPRADRNLPHYLSSNLSYTSDRSSCDFSDEHEGDELGRLEMSPSLVKSLSTPDLVDAQTPSSPLPSEHSSQFHLADDDVFDRDNPKSSVPLSPPTHVMIRELFAKYQSHRLLGLKSVVDGARVLDDNFSWLPGQRISLSEALNDPSVTAVTTQSLDCRPGSSPLPFLTAASSFYERKKAKKVKLPRRTSSKIFGIGSSKTKKSKEEIKRCQQTHSFVSVSFSNATPCQICGKPLAHKSASQCQNCHLACHESGCLDLIDPCPAASGMRATDRTISVNTAAAAATSAGSVASAQTVPSVVIDKMISEHGYAASTVPEVITSLGLIDPRLQLASQPLKRLSVPSSFESQGTTLGSAHSESSLLTTTSNNTSTNNTPSPPASFRRPISPGGLSRWKYVADKLLNKPGSTETHADSDSASEDVSVADNPDVKDVLPYARLLDFDAELKLATPEPEAWSMMQDKEYLGTLTEKEIKRQDIIHELIMTEKNHCAVLLIIDQIYIRGLRYELQWPDTEIQKFFPSFPDILNVHLKFFRQLRARQQQSRLVSNVGDILIDQFGGERGDQMKRAYGSFCSHHKEAGLIYKSKLNKDRRFAAFDTKCIDKLKCHSSRFDIPSCILLVTQRISKYRLLIESIYQKTDQESPDKPDVAKAFDCVKDVLTYIDGSIGAEERRKRLNEIYRAMDSKSSTLINGEEWKKHLLYDRELICDGPVHFRKANGKVVEIQSLLLSDCIVFLQENNQKFSFAHVDDKPAVVPLNKLIIRAKAEKSGIPEKSLYLISTVSGGGMYELICHSVKECEKWRTEITNVCNSLHRVQEETQMATSPSPDLNVDETQLRKIRDTIVACQARDDAIRRLCQEKEVLIREMIDVVGIPPSRLHLPPLLNISEDNYGTEQMQTIIKSALSETGKLIPSNSNYDATSAMISPTTLNVPSLGSDLASPGPRRAETFGGFDINKEKDANGVNANRSTSMKDPSRSRRPPHGPLSLKSSGAISDKSSSLVSSRDSCAEYSSSSAISSSPGSSPRMSTLINPDDSTLALPSVLQLHWYLNQLMDGVARQSTAFERLNALHGGTQQQLAALSARDKKMYKHSVQLEELRSLQEAFTKEKNQYATEKENENVWLKQKRADVDKDMAKLKVDKEDVEKQRNAMFAQCEKLRENGLDVVLSSHPPYVQIFNREPPAVSQPFSAPPVLQLETPRTPGREPPIPIQLFSSHPIAGRSAPPIPTDARPRPLLATSNSLNPIRVTTTPSGPFVQQLRPPSDSRQLIPGALAGNWKGSMESLSKKTEAAKDKFRSFYEGHDKTDSLPRQTLRTTSETKLGIGNLMHLSEKKNVINGGGSITSSGHGPISSDTKKKSSDKKRSFL